MFRLAFLWVIVSGVLGVSVSCAELVPDDPENGPLDAGGETSPPIDAHPTLDTGASDAPAGDGGPTLEDADGSSADADATPGCSLASGSADFYVNGDAGVSFASITAALAAANASCAETKTVHVGAGTYTAATGEVFPLVLRGVSLVGESAASTIIQGTGAIAGLEPPNDVSTASAPVLATLQIGSLTQTTVVQNVQLVPPDAYQPGTEAIVCDEGNVSTTTLAPENTLVDGVTIGAFEVGVRVMSAPPTLGCNLRVSGSQIEGAGVGLHAEGNDGVPVAVQVDGENTFANLSIQSGALAFNGGAVIARDFVSELTLRDNQITDCDQALLVYTLASGPIVSVDIEGNDISRMGNQAIALVGPLSVTLIDNTVTGTYLTTSNQGVGLLVDIKSSTVPVITRARSNSFVSNYIGVFYREASYAGSLAGLAGTDFGTASDPGNNTFRCNKFAAGNVVFQLDAGAMTFPFEGNVWDHAPPVNGTDYSVTSAELDTAGATAIDPATCP